MAIISAKTTRQNSTKKKRPSYHKKFKKHQHDRENKQAMLNYQKQHPSESLRSIANKFEIGRTVTRELVSGKTSVDSVAGRKPLLNDVEETQLKEWIFEMVDHGFPISETKVIEMADLMLKEKTTKEIHVSEGWYYDFKQRHQDVVIRMQDHLSNVRRESQNENTVGLFFDLLKSIIDGNGLSASQI